MPRSFHSYQRKVFYVILIKPTMLITHTPRTPIPLLWPIQLIHILLSISKRNHIVKIPTEQPDPDRPAQKKYLPVLQHRPPLRNRIVQMRTNRPMLRYIFNMESMFVQIPIVDSPLTRWTLRNLPQGNFRSRYMSFCSHRFLALQHLPQPIRLVIAFGTGLINIFIKRIIL